MVDDPGSDYGRIPGGVCFDVRLAEIDGAVGPIQRRQVNHDGKDH